MQFVSLDLEQNEDEQQIFETINSLGVRLTTSDMLKNYLFGKKNRKSYEENWVQVFEPDDYIDAYWKTEVSAGSKKRTLMDLFFDAYLQVLAQDRRFRVKADDKKRYSRINYLFKSYQGFVRKYLNGDKDRLIEEMAEYANCFRDTFDPEVCKKPWESNNELLRLNVVIFGLDNTTLIPYVLFLKKRIAEKQRFFRMCGVLESFIMRRMVGDCVTKNYNRFFTSLILKRIDDVIDLKKEIRGAGDTTMAVPNDEALEKGFLETKLTNKQAKGVLYLIESGCGPWSKYSTYLLKGINDYSLEHLMPKKWQNNWGRLKNDTQIKERDRIILTLGNLAIIPQKLNSSLSDSSWQKKLNGIGNQKGLKEYAKGLHTMKNVIKKPYWDEDFIARRSRWLCKEAKRIWKKI